MAQTSLKIPFNSFVEREFTAEVNILARQPVYVSSDDTVALAQADSVATSKCIGFASADATAGSPVKVRQFGELDGFLGLLANDTMFLSDSVPGGIQNTPPTSAGATIVSLGKCLSSTKILIDIQTTARRAS